MRKAKKREIILMPPKTTRPENPCHCCGGESWWQTPWGGWLCETCHPDPLKLDSASVKAEKGEGE